MSPAPPFSTAKIRQLLLPFSPDVSDALAEQLSAYLQLLVRWNARTNLTAVREPEAMVTRHFGESLFAAHALPAGPGTLLDFGSGAGFPGLPIALARPDWHVTLAESQGKKTAFLREAIRTMGVDAEIWPARVESMLAPRRFRVVTLRAVDDTDLALQQARLRVERGGLLMHLRSAQGVAGEIAIPTAERRVLHLEQL